MGSALLSNLVQIIENHRKVGKHDTVILKTGTWITVHISGALKI